MDNVCLSVLVVSSDQKERSLLCRHLRRAAYRVSQGIGWREVQHRLIRKPDLLLLDLSLKEAWKVLKWTKKVNGGIPVVAFDPHRNALRELKAFHLGADGYLGRPQMKEELISAVDAILGKNRIQQKYEKLLAEGKRTKRALERKIRTTSSTSHRLGEFVEKITSNIPISILIVDRGQRVIYANRNFRKAMGWRTGEPQGRTLVQVFPETLYDPIGLIDKVESALMGGRPTPRLTMAYRGQTYAYRVLPVSRRAVGGTDPSREAMILIENVSELKELGEKVRVSEERYRTLFENSPEGILVTRLKGGEILEVNRQAERLLGRSRSQLKTRSFRNLYPKALHGSFRERLKETTLHRGLELPDLLIHRGQGKNCLLSVTTSSIYHKGQEASLFILKDMTEKRFLEDQVRQTEKLSLLEQFAAGAAHEINNPLAIISSHAQYLIDGIQDGKIGRKEFEEIREAMNLIDREARYCGGIIKNLLAYTHTRGVSREPVEIGAVTDNCLKMVEHQLQLSNVTVQKSIDPTLPRVLGDHNLLQQVLMNLIMNAQAAMPKGGELRIQARRNGRWIELFVIDTGCGIAKQNLTKVFDPFFTTKEVGKGTGIGLWVVRSIVEEYKGTVGVQSRVGKGTTFTIRMPATEA